MGQSTWGVIVCQIHRRIPQSRVASLFLRILLFLHVGIQELELYKEEAKHNRMETQDNGFLLVIDGVRKEKERLTAAKINNNKKGRKKKVFSHLTNLKLNGGKQPE